MSRKNKGEDKDEERGEATIHDGKGPEHVVLRVLYYTTVAGGFQTIALFCDLFKIKYLNLNNAMGMVGLHL